MLLIQIRDLETEFARRRYLQEPDAWVEEALGEFLWSLQKKIARSIVAHRRTAVPSCHESGKSFLAARIAAWWLTNHPPGDAMVVTSAPTGKQVRAILWREIGRAHAKGKLPGRTNQTEWHMTMPAGNEELVGFGQKPDDMDPAAFQGIHAKFVLVIFDEACGMPELLWEAADTLIANDNSRILAIGNPDDPDTEFHKICMPGSGWNVIPIDAFKTPNFTGENVPSYIRPLLIGRMWVEEKRRKWGETNPLWLAKVRGQFPILTTDGLIPMRWIRTAQIKEYQPIPGDENVIGTDVGGGGDKNISCHRHGERFRIIRRDQEPDTMVSLGNLIADMETYGAERAQVDYIGIGKGMVDRAKEQRLPIVGVNVSMMSNEEAQRQEKKKGKRDDASTSTYANLRAEGYWRLRERFQDGRADIDPDDDDLAAQLVALKYKRNSRGQIVIVSKDELKRELHRSPDEADACMLSDIVVRDRKRKRRGGTWGRKASHAA